MRHQQNAAPKELPLRLFDQRDEVLLVVQLDGEILFTEAWMMTAFVNARLARLRYTAIQRRDVYMHLIAGGQLRTPRSRAASTGLAVNLDSLVISQSQSRCQPQFAIEAIEACVLANPKE